jgi:hypothetical protein
VDARSGAVDRSFPDLTVTGLVADGRRGWFATTGALVRLDAHARIDANWHAQLPSGASATRLARVGTRLYVTLGRQIEALDAATGRKLWLSKVFAPGTTTHTVHLNAIAADTHVVYIGGDFSRVGRTPRQSVVAFDVRDGHLLAWRIPPVKFEPYDIDVLTRSGSRLYLGGVFGSVGGRYRSNLAAVDARTGALLPWAPKFTADETTSIAVVGRTVAVGGTFDFEAYDVTTGRAKRWARELGGSPTVLEPYGSTLYLGGNLRSFFGTPSGKRNNLGAVDVSTGRVLDWGPNLARFVTVGAIARAGDQVLVGGTFTASIG